MLANSNKNFHFFIWISFIINFIIKLYKIDYYPFSFDEIVSVKDTLLDFGHIKHEAEWDSNPPFYYYCLWIWEKLFGLSEMGIRSFSAFFSSLTLVTMAYYLSKNFNKSISLFFIVVYSFNPVLLFYAQEARCYSLLFFLTSISIIAFQKFINNKNIMSCIMLGTINFLLFYTHYIAALIIVFQFIFCVIYFRKHLIKFVLANLIALALVLLRFTKKQFQLILGVTTDKDHETWISKATFSDFLNFFDTIYFSYLFFIVFVFMVLYLIFKRSSNTQDKERLIKYFVFVSFLTPVLFFIIGRLTPVFMNRYILFSMIFTFILLAKVIYELKIYGYVLLVLVLFFEVKSLEFGQSKGIDFKSVASFVHKIKSQPLIIINKKDVTELFTYYYDISLFKSVSYKDKSGLNKRNIYDANDLEEIKRINFEGQKVILLFQTFANEKLSNEIYKWLIEHNYKMEKYDIFTGVKFSLFKKV